MYMMPPGIVFSTGGKVI